MQDPCDLDLLCRVVGFIVFQVVIWAVIGASCRRD